MCLCPSENVFFPKDVYRFNLIWMISSEGFFFVPVLQNILLFIVEWHATFVYFYLLK